MAQAPPRACHPGIGSPGGEPVMPVPRPTSSPATATATATTPPNREAARHRTPRAGVLLLVLACVWAASAGTAWADPGMVMAEPASLAEVVGRLRTLIVGLLAAVATLYLTIGGVRYLTANGDPGAI